VCGLLLNVGGVHALQFYNTYMFFVRSSIRFTSDLVDLLLDSGRKETVEFLLIKILQWRCCLTRLKDYRGGG
jgi:hypothetical protein